MASLESSNADINARPSVQHSDAVDQAFSGASQLRVDPAESVARLSELLESVETEELRDPAFPLNGEDRRRDQRHPFLTEVVAVLELPVSDIKPPQVFKFIRGWTLNLSPTGLGFVLTEELEADSVLLLISHPDYSYPQNCFNARIFRVEKTGESEWEYGALIRPLFQTGLPFLFGKTSR